MPAEQTILLPNGALAALWAGRESLAVLFDQLAHAECSDDGGRDAGNRSVPLVGLFQLFEQGLHGHTRPQGDGEDPCEGFVDFRVAGLDGRVDEDLERSGLQGRDRDVHMPIRRLHMHPLRVQDIRQLERGGDREVRVFRPCSFHGKAPIAVRLAQIEHLAVTASIAVDGDPAAIEFPCEHISVADVFNGCRGGQVDGLADRRVAEPLPGSLDPDMLLRGEIVGHGKDLLPVGGNVLEPSGRPVIGRDLVDEIVVPPAFAPGRGFEEVAQVGELPAFEDVLEPDQRELGLTAGAGVGNHADRPSRGHGGHVAVAHLSPFLFMLASLPRRIHAPRLCQLL